MVAERATPIPMRLAALSTVLHGWQDKVKSSSKISEEQIREWKTEMFASMEEFEFLHLLPARRDVMVTYRGIDFPVHITCHDQWSHWILTSVVREVATNEGSLVALPAELCGVDATPVPESARTVDAACVAGAQASRERLWKLVNSHNVCTGSKLRDQPWMRGPKKLNISFIFGTDPIVFI
eukprot:6491909-Amphidinium_carterae.1